MKLSKTAAVKNERRDVRESGHPLHLEQNDFMITSRVFRMNATVEPRYCVADEDAALGVAIPVDTFKAITLLPRQLQTSRLVRFGEDAHSDPSALPKVWPSLGCPLHIDGYERRRQRRRCKGTRRHSYWPAVDVRAKRDDPRRKTPKDLAQAGCVMSDWAQLDHFYPLSVIV
jgi:hypothetical protein